jgi:hypothetical protein
MDYPASVLVRQLATVPILSAMIIGSDFALSGAPDVKLMDAIVFAAAYMLGFRVGASVAVISETVWSVVSPWGVAGSITPFLVVGELLFAAAGTVAAKAWDVDSSIGARSLNIGAVLAMCAFVWDLETNFGTALIASWPSVTLAKVAAYELFGTPFMLLHELSDFALGMVFVPLIVLVIRRRLTLPTAQIARGTKS